MRPGIRDDTERSDDRSTHRGQTGYRVKAGLWGEHKLALRTRSHTHTHTPSCYPRLFYSIWPNLVGAHDGSRRSHMMTHNGMRRPRGAS